MWKKFEAARFLAKKGADVNSVDPKSGRTALHYGVEKEFDPAQLAWLVARGASPDIDDKKGISARDRARRKRDKRWFNALAGPLRPTGGAGARGGAAAPRTRPAPAGQSPPMRRTDW